MGGGAGMPDFLSVDDVLLIHADQIERYGGDAGLRDRGLLEAAVAMPMAGLASGLLHGPAQGFTLATLTVMPVHDWQFWVVTVIAVGALAYLLRRVVPAGLLGKKKPGTKTSLTIGGKAVGEKKK